MNVEPRSEIALPVTTPHKPHTMTATWRTFSGELEPTITISCPYEADDFDKPCRIWASGWTDDGTYEVGCWVQQTLDAVGWADMAFAIPDDTQGPWDMHVTGTGDDGPWLTDVRLS